MRLATYLRAKRRELGWSQETLAKKAGYATGNGSCVVSHIENGRLRGDKRDAVIRLGSALGCRQELLLLAGYAPEIDTLGTLEAELARAIRSALNAGLDQAELAEMLRGWARDYSTT